MKKLFVSLLFVLTTILCVAQNAKMPANVTLKALNGSSVPSSALQNGDKPFVISFWATWCHPCNRELNAIKDVYEEWQEETGVKIIAISIDDARSANRVKPHVDGHDWPYEVYIDENQDFKRAMNVINVPHTFIINAQGEIVWQHTGYVPGDEEELFEEVKKVLEN